MVRMQDVAREAEVSLMTVSNVVNGRGKMSVATRERVLEAMQKLDYRVNRAAQNLRTGRTGTIGLAVPDLDSWYMAQLTARVVEAARARGMTVAIELTGASARGELASVAHSRKLMYDGLILSVAGMTPEEVRVLHADHPLVIIGEGIPEAHVDRVALANEEGGWLAGRHLIEQGSSRPVIVAQHGPRAPAYSALRTKGFLAAVRSAGALSAPPHVISPPSYSLEGGRTAARDLLERQLPFDGIFAATDSTAIGVIRGLADAGIRAPDDVLIVGFDDVNEARYSIPSLTSVNPDHDFVARTSVDLLLDRIENGEAAGPPRELINPPSLVVRESSAGQIPPPVTH